MKMFAMVVLLAACTRAGQKAQSPAAPKPDPAATVDPAARRAAYASQCTEPNVLCLGTDGEPFDGQAEFAIPEGEKLTVRVLSANDADKETYRVQLSIKHNLDSLTPSNQHEEGIRAEGATQHEYSVVASATSVATGEKDLSVGFELEHQAGASYSHVRSGRVLVEHGSYYFEFGIGLPIVYHGSRTAMSAARISSSTEPRAAFSVLYFPFGRHKTQLDYHGDFWHSLGIFGGTDFDFTKIQRDFHLGVAYSPIQGLGIAAGLSVIPVQFLADSSAMTTNGAINTSTHEVLRPFIGVFLTTDFLNTASQAKTALLAVGK